MMASAKSRFPTARNSLKKTDAHLLDDVQDLGWKLYGKNEHFAITCNAVVKIQAFVRGCMSRGKTSEMIQELIDGILSYREIVAKYAAEDEARVQKQQLTSEPTEESDVKEESPSEPKEEVEEYSVAPKRTSTQARPWTEREAGYVHPSTPLEFQLHEVLDTKEPKNVSERPWLKKKQASTPITTAESTDESSSDSSSGGNDSESSSDDSDFGSSSDESGSSSSSYSSVESPVKKKSSLHTSPVESPVPKSERMQGSLKDRLNFWESKSPQKSSPPLNSSKISPNKVPPIAKLPPLPVNTEKPPKQVRREVASVKSSSSLESVESYYNTPNGKKEATPISSRASTPIMQNSSHHESDADGIDPIVQFPAEFEESADLVPEPGGRGYQRYKTKSNFRNKQRPWRDDTNVFDAY